MHSDTRDNKSIVQRFIEDVYTRLDAAAVDRLVSEDFRSHGSPSFDRHGLRTATQRMGKALDHIRFVVEDMIAEEDRVAVRLRSGARQTGEFMGIPATGRTYEIEEIHIFRIEQGQIVEHWHQLDSNSLMAQLAPKTD